MPKRCSSAPAAPHARSNRVITPASSATIWSITELAGRCVNSPGHGRTPERVHDVSNHIPAGTLCVYCGWDADSIDHLLPRPWTGETGRRLSPKVPACKDCNARIGGRHAPTIEERRSLVWDSLERKHRKLLAATTWHDDELKRLGPHLRASIEAREALRRIVSFRLDNLARDEGSPLDNWVAYSAAYGDNFLARIVAEA